MHTTQTRPEKRSFMSPINRFLERWIPSALTFAIILTIIVAILAMTLTQSSPVDGSYARTLRAGTVEVEVRAPGYLSETIQSVSLAGGQTQTRDFALLSVCERLFDDAEQGGANWTAQSPWVIGSGVGGHAGKAWHTPGYPNNANVSLTLAANLDLTGYADLVLEFEDRCATEANYDFGYVEYSSNGGAKE